MGAKDVALADTLKAEVAALKEQQPALEAEEKAGQGRARREARRDPERALRRRA